ncbi:peptidoglycan-binding domain-containing protein [Anabaena cylindrica UHCC 0172]|uniref:peptidoglycan-binding domain-containing protein n=1 Tax=Anabaena cylindrica TaxID=1165 RepID=UPI002B2015B8|nr:peptidoglycan-binding domain-containing protein [Anabaena cylindrica]MEA5554098.1 peptidoglycan-binding domain-containing protein [Anabaena cylindrica UHCC 0172]
MGKLHIGFKKKDDANSLHQELWGKQGISRLTVTARKPKTGEYLVSVETDSQEIQEEIQSCGGRILSNEEYEALTAYSIGDAWITHIQMDLARKGYYLPTLPSGVFDEETKYAVIAFQRDNGLEVNGIVNEEMMEKLRSANQRPSFLQTASSLQLDGPADWSVNIDYYLYGTETKNITNAEI